MYAAPEQQPEGPLGIENAKSGRKEGFEKHSGHGRLYRPQATLARPPPSGEHLSLSASVPVVAGHAAAMLPVSSPEAPLCCAAMLRQLLPSWPTHAWDVLMRADLVA